MGPRRTTTTLQGITAFRWSTYDTPFWARNNTSPGRWHVTGDGPTQYVSLDPRGAWAEFARAQDVRDEATLSLARVPVWALRIDVTKIADYATFEKAEAAGFPPEALVDDDWTRCQEEGALLRAAGFQGVLAPSAARANSTNLTLFGPRVLASWDRDARLASEIPACVVAVGAPPPHIEREVRYRGMNHAGLDGFHERLAEASRRAQVGSEASEASDSLAGDADESA